MKVIFLLICCISIHQSIESDVQSPVIDTSVINCIQDQLVSIGQLHPQFFKTLIELGTNFNNLSAGCHENCEFETQVESQFNVIRRKIKNSQPNENKYWDEIVNAIEYCINSNLRKNTGIPNFSFYI